MHVEPALGSTAQHCHAHVGALGVFNVLSRAKRSYFKKRSPKNKDELVYICFSQDPIWPTSSCASTSTRPPTARKGLRRPKRFVSAAQPPELVLRASESRPTKGCTNMPETSKGRWGGEKMACGEIMSCLPVCFTRFHYNIHTQKLRVHVPELGPRVRLNHRTEHLRCQLQPLQL